MTTNGERRTVFWFVDEKCVKPDPTLDGPNLSSPVAQDADSGAVRIVVPGAA